MLNLVSHITVTSVVASDSFLYIVVASVVASDWFPFMVVASGRVRLTSFYSSRVSGHVSFIFIYYGLTRHARYFWEGRVSFIFIYCSLTRHARKYAVDCIFLREVASDWFPFMVVASVVASDCLPNMVVVSVYFPYIAVASDGHVRSHQIAIYGSRVSLVAHPVLPDSYY